MGKNVAIKNRNVNREIVARFGGRTAHMQVLDIDDSVRRDGRANVISCVKRRELLVDNEENHELEPELCCFTEKIQLLEGFKKVFGLWGRLML